MTSSLRPVLALALAAALTAACSSGDDTGAAGNSDATTTIEVPTTEAGSEEVPADAQGDLFEVEPTTTAPPASDGDDDEPAGIAPNEWGAPEPGDYQYSVGTNGESAVLRVFDHNADRRRDLYQTVVFQQRKRRDAQLVLWQADGMWMISEQAEEAGGSVLPRCDWQPSYLELPRPLEVGRAWGIDSTCQSGDFTRHRQGSVRVTGVDRIQIAGTAYDVFVIERDVTTTVSNTAGVPFASQRRQATDRWAHGLGLLARSDATVSTTLEGVEQGSSPDRRQLVDPNAVR